MALQKRIREMEDKLQSIDKAIQTFSKKIVYIAVWNVEAEVNFVL